MGLMAAEALTVLLRWVHITSAVLLVGGLAYARLAAVPALRRLDGDERLTAWEGLAASYRMLVYLAIAGLLVSGVFNFLIHPGHTMLYHVWFGIKMLLAAHVFAVSILVVQPIAKPEDEARLERRLASGLVSGLFVILVAAFLRRIF